MKHLFSSGEIINHQHERTIAEGKLVGKTLDYESVSNDATYRCHGTIEGRPVTVAFKLSEESMQHVSFRHMLGILMQSDIFEGEWLSYELEDIAGNSLPTPE